MTILGTSEPEDLPDSLGFDFRMTAELLTLCPTERWRYGRNERYLENNESREGTVQTARPQRRSRLNRALQLLAVIGIISLLAGGVLLLVNALKSSGEYSVVQRNIDNVGVMTDTYWNSFAADNDGRRKLTPFKLCQYVNSQMNSEEVNFRTLQIVTSAAAL